MGIRKASQRQRGLNLIELVLAMAIVGFLGVATLRALRTTSASMKAVEVKLDADNQAETLLKQFKKDFAKQLPTKDLNLSMQGQVELNFADGGLKRYTNICDPNPLPAQFVSKTAAQMPYDINGISTGGLNVFCANTCAPNQRPLVLVEEYNSGYAPVANYTLPQNGTQSIFGMKLCVRALNKSLTDDPVAPYSGDGPLEYHPNDKYMLLVLAAWDPGKNQKIVWDVRGSYLFRPKLAH